MLCYRDRTFCVANCANTSCDRKLTDQVERDAKRWWGKEGAPIAMSDFSKSCEQYKQLEGSE